jgi:hypothetical protein
VVMHPEYRLKVPDLNLPRGRNTQERINEQKRKKKFCMGVCKYGWIDISM